MKSDMREIGGYIELDNYNGQMLHDKAVALNCARSCLSYLIQAKKITKIVVPKYLCASVRDVCKREQVTVRYYSIDEKFLPTNILLDTDEWLYVVNYYGQLDDCLLQQLHAKYHRIIVDNVQAYFREPIKGIDTIYTCRKFFGVTDGALLYTDTIMNCEFEQDQSFERIRYLFGRYERCADEFYGDYTTNEALFMDVPIRSMSKLTRNLLHAIDYSTVKEKRTNNFQVLHDAFKEKNKLHLKTPEGAFMYPLYIEHGAHVRGELQKRKIYIPILWPDVFKLCDEKELEYDMAKNILPLPVDQRYGKEDMLYLIQQIENICKEV